jgi:hypothetical protein
MFPRLRQCSSSKRFSQKMRQDGGSGPSVDYVLCKSSLDVSCSQSSARQAEYFYQEMHLTVVETYVGSIDTVAVEIANPRCSPLVGSSSQSLKPFWKSSWLFQWPSLSPIYKPTSKTRCSQSVSSSADLCTLSQSPFHPRPQPNNTNIF